jgi:hypothetical protein
MEQFYDSESLILPAMCRLASPYNGQTFRFVLDIRYPGCLGSGGVSGEAEKLSAQVLPSHLHSSSFGKWIRK